MSSNIRINKTCEYCGNEYIARTVKTRYCSHKCNSRHYKQKARELKIINATKETKTANSKQNVRPNINNQTVLSINEVCELLGISRNTVYRLIKSDQLNTTRIRGRVLIKRTEIKKAFNI